MGDLKLLHKSETVRIPGWVPVSLHPWPTLLGGQSRAAESQRTKERVSEGAHHPCFLAQNQQDEFDQTFWFCVGQKNPVCHSSEATVSLRTKEVWLGVAAARPSQPLVWAHQDTTPVTCQAWGRGLIFVTRSGLLSSLLRQESRVAYADLELTV